MLALRLRYYYYVEMSDLQLGPIQKPLLEEVGILLDGMFMYGVPYKTEPATEPQIAARHDQFLDRGFERLRIIDWTEEDIVDIMRPLHESVRRDSQTLSIADGEEGVVASISARDLFGRCYLMPLLGGEEVPVSFRVFELFDDKIRINGQPLGSDGFIYGDFPVDNDRHLAIERQVREVLRLDFLLEATGIGAPN